MATRNLARYSLLRIVRSMARLAIVTLLGCTGSEADESKSPERPIPEAATSLPSGERTPENWIRALRDKGWTPEAAEAVVHLNAENWGLIDQNGPEEVDDVLDRLLPRLGGNPAWQAAVASRPHLAMLLVLAIEGDPEGPDLVLKSIVGLDSEFKTAVETLYQLGPSPSEIMETARLIEAEGSLIARLTRNGSAPLAALLRPAALPCGEEAKATYRSWVREVIEQALAASPERRDRLSSFLLIHAPTVAKHLEDEEFRAKFLATTWPLASRLQAESAEDDEMTWGVVVGSSAIWGLLHDYGDQGSKMLDRCGPVAIVLLSDVAYRPIKDQVVRALVSGDQEMIVALQDEGLRSQALFIKLLERDLERATRTRALAELTSSPDIAPTLLRDWDDLSDDALGEKLRPPPSGAITWLPGYNLYEVTRKLGQGREVGKGEIVFALTDFLELVAIGKGAKIGLGMVQKAVVGGLKHKGATMAAEKFASAGAREMIPWAVKAGFKASRETLGQIISRTATVDVTDAVRLVFKGAGFGRVTFKKLTKLEARVFMRQDRRVFIDLSQLAAKDHVLGRFLRETSKNAAAHSALETAAEAAARTEAWRKHVSAWWMANATGTLDRMAK